MLHSTVAWKLQQEKQRDVFLFTYSNYVTSVGTLMPIVWNHMSMVITYPLHLAAKALPFLNMYFASSVVFDLTDSPALVRLDLFSVMDSLYQG